MNISSKKILFNPKGKKIILCSSSPRRRELLESLLKPFGLTFSIDSNSSFVEDHSLAAQLQEKGKLTSILSEGKSQDFHRPLSDDELLITADTLVLSGSTILGKPQDYDEATKMLQLLSGKKHQVVTSVTLRDKYKQKTITESSDVYFKQLSNEEIDFYISHFKPYDKAGAYGIQEWIGYIGIEKLHGSFYNIMGLPLHRLYEELKTFLD